MDGANRGALKDVTSGRNLGTEIEVESGVTAADRVVATPLDTIEDGDLVNVTASPPAQAAPAAPATATE